MLKFTGERIVPQADNCLPAFARKMFQEHIARYQFCLHNFPGGEVLDVGCGVGYGSHFLARNSDWRITAFDLSEEAIAHARKFYSHPSINFENGNAEAFDFGKKFDLVICFELIEHVPNQEAVLRGIKKALKEDGFLVLSTPRPLGTKRSEFHVRELSFVECSNLLQQYFPYVVFFHERNHLCSLITEKQPDSLASVLHLNNDFSENTADYFLAVAGNVPISMEGISPVLVLNDDEYLLNLENDVQILKKDIDILLNEKNDFLKHIDGLNKRIRDMESSVPMKIMKKFKFF